MKSRLKQRILTIVMYQQFSKLLHYFVHEFWDSVTLLGTPILYLFTLLIVSQFNAHINLFMTLFAFFLLEVSCFFLKMIIVKKRPKDNKEKNFTNIYDQRSFPSIHSARISLLAFVLSMFIPSLTLVFVLCVVMVGYSRIYLREHDVVDVVGGIFWGLLWGILWKVFVV